MNPSDNVSEILKLLQFQKLFTIAIGLFIVVLLGNVLKRLSDRLGESVPNYRLLFLQITTMLSFGLYIFGTAALVF